MSVSTVLLAEQLAEPTGGDVAAEVHLEEPVLGLDEALRVEQVGAVVGVHLRDAVGVAQHLDLVREPLDAHGAVHLRKRAA